MASQAGFLLESYARPPERFWARSHKHNVSHAATKGSSRVPRPAHAAASRWRSLYVRGVATCRTLRRGSPSRLTLTRFVGGGVAGPRRAGVRRAGFLARRASAAAALATARSASSAERKSASAPSEPDSRPTLTLTLVSS